MKNKRLIAIIVAGILVIALAAVSIVYINNANSKKNSINSIDFVSEYEAANDEDKEQIEQNSRLTHYAAIELRSINRNRNVQLTGIWYDDENKQILFEIYTGDTTKYSLYEANNVGIYSRVSFYDKLNEDESTTTTEAQHTGNQQQDPNKKQVPTTKAIDSRIEQLMNQKDKKVNKKTVESINEMYQKGELYDANNIKMVGNSND